jgi:hypothetical protein
VAVEAQGGLTEYFYSADISIKKIVTVQPQI